MEALLAAGADPAAVDKEQESALHLAARAGHVDALALLHDCVATELRNAAGETPLVAAMRAGQKKAQELLVAAGARAELMVGASLKGILGAF